MIQARPHGETSPTGARDPGTGVPPPVGYRWITLHALISDREVVIPEQAGLELPPETGPDDLDYHSCDANGCGWEHVIGRFPLPRPSPAAEPKPTGGKP